MSADSRLLLEKLKDLQARKALTQFYKHEDDPSLSVAAYDTVKGYAIYTGADKLPHIRLNHEYFMENPHVLKKPYEDLLIEAFSSSYTHKLHQRPTEGCDFVIDKKKYVKGCYAAVMQMSEEEFFREHPDIDRYSHEPPPEDLDEKWRKRASEWM